MTYYIKIKDGIAISIDYLIPTIGSYDCDSYEETTLQFAMNAELPMKKVNGEWVHTDEYPEIEYPEPTEPIDPPELPPSLEERVADLEAENETISEVLDALLMGDIEV